MLHEGCSFIYLKFNLLYICMHKKSFNIKNKLQAAVLMYNLC